MGIEVVDKRSWERLVELAVERGANRESFIARSEGDPLDPALLFAWYREMPRMEDHSDLLLAAYVRYDELAEQLLASGADPNHRTKAGWSALIYASELGDGPLARALVAAGADPNLKAEDGSSALLSAAQQGNVEIAMLLLSAGADPGIVDSDGRTPLMAAAADGNAELVRALLERGADLQARDRTGRSVLAFAAIRGSVEVGQLLIELGVPVNDQPLSDRGRSALHEASALRRHDFMRLLVRHGANVDARLNDGKTALMLAVIWDEEAPPTDLVAVEILLNVGAAPNTTDLSGWTPLMYVAQHGGPDIQLTEGPDIALALLNHGADPNVRNNKGQTALTIALESSHDDVAAVLRNAGAKE